MSNPEKNARVGQMIKDLDGCLKTNPAVCESLWEHPRLRKRLATASDEAVNREEDDDTPWWAQVLIALSVLLGLAAVVRIVRRRSAP